VFTQTDPPGERQVYRTSGSLVAWWAWVAFAVVLLIVLAFGHRDHATLVTAAVVVAITGIMYSCALRPRIVAGAGGIAVVNPLRVHEVPWPAVTQVDLVHNVRVHYRDPAGGVPGGGVPAGGMAAGGMLGGGMLGRGMLGGEKIVHSWAVQSTGRSRTRSELRARRAARRGMTPEPGYARLPDTARAALAGSAAEFIARQLDERARLQRSAASAADAGSGGGPDVAPAVAQVRWNWGPIVVMVVPLLILLAVTLA
jgi:Bacterial PH domain